MTASGDPQETRGLGRGMLIIFWILFLGVLTWGFGIWEGNLFNPNRQPETADSNEYRQVILDSNRQHHYVVTGAINSRKVTFLLDTGATDVVVPAGLAGQLGLRRGAAGRAMTANGMVTIYRTTLDSVQIGSILLRNVEASINPGMDGNGVLLGMSALRSIEFTQRDGQLILRQPVADRI